MVQMFLYLRFRGQLRRTNPVMIASLENAVAEAAAAAGGIVENGRKVLSASFDDDRIGFWLDMVIFLEKAGKVLGEAAPGLYGYALALGRNIPETSIQKLCRTLSAKNDPGSACIWCSAGVREALDLFLAFDNSSRKPAGEIRDEYWEFSGFKLFDRAALSSRSENPYREKIGRALAQGGDRNTVLLGPEFMGKRDAIYHYCAGMLGDIPPLAVRFGRGGFGFTCFTDAFTPKIRAFIASAINAAAVKELDTIHALLFGERLRDEWSPHIIGQGGRFFSLLLAAYIAAAGTHSAAGILVLEDLSSADERAVELMRGLCTPELKILILASDSSSEENLRPWAGIFPRMLLFTPDDFSAQEKESGGRDFYGKIPRDIWEVSCNILLLEKFFPPYLFPQLFEEEGLSRDMYSRASQMLMSFGMLASSGMQNAGELRPRSPDFIRGAERIPESRKEKIRSAVRNRILSWAQSGRIRPCFSLLKILLELGENAGDVLVLRSIRADVLNGTCGAIEQALADRSFVKLVGKANMPALSYAYRTLRVLAWGSKDEIHRVFREAVPPSAPEDGKPCYSGCQVQVQINLASYHLGCRNVEASSEAVRRAMLLNRELGKDAVPAYRLFALVNLFRQRIDDALEYISFALDEAERTEQNEELVLTCFFASSINFAYGNLSKAERLAKRAEETATALGQTEWGTMAKFFRGRLCFETGRYSDALEIFESLDLSGAGESHSSGTMVQTIRAWAYRTRNFLGRPNAPEVVDSLTGVDASIFRIEAAFLSGDYERSAALASDFQSATHEGPDNDFLFTEQPDWKSGYSQCEAMYQPGKDPAGRLVWVYRAMAQCAFHPSQEKTAEILGGMQRFMREEFLPDSDPNDAFFFYAWYGMLRSSQAAGGSFAAQIDINTVVSMAYKRLQRRAGRIDDMGTRQAFLNMPRWSSALCLAAREYKLI